MKRLALSVAAALILSAGQAAADGLPSRSHVAAPPEAAAPNWNGFYLGVGVGAGAVSFELNGFDGDFGGRGAFGSVTVGYDRVIRPGWVAGVFTDFDVSGITSRAAPADLDHAWSIGGRLGFLTNPTTLLYGTGGYSQARFDFGANEGAHTFGGYFVGAGIETLLRQDWTLKLEYRLSHTEGTSVFRGTSLDHWEPEEHSARLVLSYKFGQRN